MKDEGVYSPGDKVIYSIVRHSSYNGNHCTGAWHTSLPVFCFFFFVPRGKSGVEYGRVPELRDSTL